MVYQSIFGGREESNTRSPIPFFPLQSKIVAEDINSPIKTVESGDNLFNILELAADNDIKGFRQAVGISSAINETGLWYGRVGRSKKMALKHRTPLMVAATYGSVDVVKLILFLPELDINCSCSPDKSTALHCAASGGSSNAVDVVKLLILSGADPNAIDGNGHRPLDVIVTPPMGADIKVVLEELLKYNSHDCQQNIEPCAALVKSKSPTLSAYNDIDCLPVDLDSTSVTLKPSEKKEYPIDPSLDINNTIYASDEFRMFSFKVRPCSRAYSHDWTECPFVHPGENARRRDPKKYHYSCMPCPDSRKGACRRGDMCEYAHGVFESWLHPAQYKTRLCKDGTFCARRVCFFSHTPEELRPLYVSTGSAFPSPRSATPMDMAMALNHFPGSPTMASVLPPPFSPPMSPSGNGISHSAMTWSQHNVPTLNLPVANFQASRLRLSLNARDLAPREQHQLLNEFSNFSPPQFNSSSPNLSIRSKSLNPSNLDQLFSAEDSPRHPDQFMASSFFSPPSHRSVILNPLQHQQNMSSPTNSNALSSKNMSSFGLSSSNIMSPRSFEPISPMSSRLATLAYRDKQQFRSLSSRGLESNLPRDILHNSAGIVGSPVNSWPKRDSFNGKVDWSVQDGDTIRSPKSSTIGLNGIERPSSLIRERSTVSGVPLSAEESVSNSQVESIDHGGLGTWLEQMQLDQLVAS